MRRLAVYTLFVLLFVTAGTPHSWAQAPSEEIVLRVALWAGAEEMKMEQRIADAFMEQHPGVRVEIESIPSNYKEKILATLAAGTVADVILLDSPIIPTLLNKNALVNLTPYTDEFGIDLEQYFPSVLDIYSRNDSLLAFPKGFTPVVMYYNKRLFDEAGVPYPEPGWTWQDYLDKARQLTRDDNGDGIMDQFGTVFVTDLYLWQPWVWSNGGDIVSPAGTQATGFFDAPETEETLQFLIDLRTKYHVAPHNLQTVHGSYASAASGLFYTNRIAMIPNGHWALLGLQDYLDRGDLEVGVVPLPVPEGGTHATVLYGAGWSVMKQTQHPEWAVRLAAFLGGDEAAQIRASTPIEIPAIQEVARQKAANDPYGFEQVFLDDIAYGRQSWGTKIDEFLRIEQITKQAVEEVLIADRDIHEGFTEAAHEIDEVLATVRVYTEDTSNLRGNREILLFLILTALLAVAAATAGTFVVPKPERRPLLTGYRFLAPSFILLLIFILTPVLFSLYLSFHEWNVVSSNKPFVGLDNFVRLFDDRRFWHAFVNTAVYTLHVPLGMAIALVLAVLMNQNIRGARLLRALYFLPSISSFVAVALVWKWLYHPQFGLFNYGLAVFGLPPLDWLSNPQTALLSVMLLSIWMAVGYQMIIFLAGLQGIPGEMYEAAEVDGAGPLRRFWHITLPMLKPTTFFVLVTSVISSFQVFSLIYVMTQGGPVRSTDVVVFHIYQNAWEYLQMGYASAMSWVLFLVILLATWIQFRLAGRDVSYG
ncbi:MAG TPA: extracellular solute-binding protein [Rhodothermales bacterium]|nr:extracellular solute-binding protein [Rhodothermales bacterium]